jgi:hypothetical protein
VSFQHRDTETQLWAYSATSCVSVSLCLCVNSLSSTQLQTVKGLPAVVAVRVLFFAFHYAPETRYIVEVYPPLIAACGAAAWAWPRVSPLTHKYFGRRDVR